MKVDMKAVEKMLREETKNMDMMNLRKFAARMGVKRVRDMQNREEVMGAMMAVESYCAFH